MPVPVVSVSVAVAVCVTPAVVGITFVVPFWPVVVVFAGVAVPCIAVGVGVDCSLEPASPAQPASATESATSTAIVVCVFVVIRRSSAG
ncbi:MAG TPA: hypothetical protein VFJ06_07130 [Halococcus sp.]|nr:hypothetical protein [Halococcus sp.]